MVVVVIMYIGNINLIGWGVRDTQYVSSRSVGSSYISSGVCFVLFFFKEFFFWFFGFFFFFFSKFVMQLKWQIILKRIYSL